LQDDHPPDQQPTRRSLLGFLTLLFGAAPLVAALYTSLRAGLTAPHSDRRRHIPLCRLDEVPDDGIKEVVIHYEMRRGPVVESVAKVVFVTRDPKTREVLALSGECTHLSCPVQNRRLATADGETAPLTCPCHGGKFSRTGEVLAGPPKRPLRRLPLEPLPTDATAEIYLREV